MTLRDDDKKEDDDARWLETLAGRDTHGTLPATALEARLLRQATRRLPLLPVQPLTASREQRLVAALNAEPTRFWRCGGCVQRWRALRKLVQTRPQWVSVLAATSLCAAVLAMWLLPLTLMRPVGGGDEPVLRDAASLAVRVRAVVDPLAQRDRLAADLTAQGAQVKRYERLGRFGLDAEWPGGAAPTDALARLQIEGLALPADGIVRIEFVASLP